jgi:hypothetical protein
MEGVLGRPTSEGTATVANLSLSLG